MFFRKKKEKKENETIHNAVFGELEFIDCAWEGDSKSTLFGEEKDIHLYVYVDEDEKIIEENQEKAYLNYIRSQKEIEEAAEKVILKHFRLPEKSDLPSRFTARSVIVTASGNCGIEIVDKTHEMGHSHYSFVIDTEPGHELTETEQHYLNTK